MRWCIDFDLHSAPGPRSSPWVAREAGRGGRDGRWGHRSRSTCRCVRRCKGVSTNHSTSKNARALHDQDPIFKAVSLNALPSLWLLRPTPAEFSAFRNDVSLWALAGYNSLQKAGVPMTRSVHNRSQGSKSSNAPNDAGVACFVENLHLPVGILHSFLKAARQRVGHRMCGMWYQQLRHLKRGSSISSSLEPLDFQMAT